MKLATLTLIAATAFPQIATAQSFHIPKEQGVSFTFTAPGHDAQFHHNVRTNDYFVAQQPRGIHFNTPKNPAKFNYVADGNRASFTAVPEGQDVKLSTPKRDGIYFVYNQ